MLKYGGLSRQVSGKFQEDALQHIISRYNHQQTIKIRRTVKKLRQSEGERKREKEKSNNKSKNSDELHAFFQCFLEESSKRENTIFMYGDRRNIFSNFLFLFVYLLNIWLNFEQFTINFTIYFPIFWSTRIVKNIREDWLSIHANIITYRAKQQGEKSWKKIVIKIVWRWMIRTRGQN